MAGLNETPRSDRVHIAFFGRTNAGKSSTINLITGSDTALVSPVAGTTTDPVYKSMELLPVGPVVLIDTGGTDDRTELGQARVDKAREVVKKTDVAVILGDDEPDDVLREFRSMLNERGTPIVEVRNVRGPLPETREDALIYINAESGEGRGELIGAIVAEVSRTEDVPLTRGLVSQGDLVVLVMPQDPQAPRGRLILPQVQTIRDLLDADCRVLCVKPHELSHALRDLRRTPDLVVTDSQVFADVAAVVPRGVPLTSFSILMGKKRGDIEAFVEGARAIQRLRPGSRVLIAEACTHHAKKGDIARDKIPMLLEKEAGGPIDVTVCSGPSFPEDLASYDLIVHCGACMINRANMLSRVRDAKEAGVPMANFGTTLAYCSRILSEVVF